MDNRFISLLRTSRVVPDEDAALILDAFEKRHFAEGSELFRGGHVCRQLFFIMDGVLRIVVQNDKGMEVTHFFLKEGQFCTILKSFKEEAIADESIQAACAVEVLTIGKGKLLELYERLPYLEGVIGQIIQKGLIDKINTRNVYLGVDSTTRYQLFLDRQPEIASRVSLADVASYLGVTPQSLSRIRRKK
jgi:CRP-like cAMP-binding protein